MSSSPNKQSVYLRMGEALSQTSALPRSTLIDSVEIGSKIVGYLPPPLQHLFLLSNELFDNYFDNISESELELRLAECVIVKRTFWEMVKNHFDVPASGKKIQLSPDWEIAIIQ